MLDANDEEDGYYVLDGDDERSKALLEYERGNVYNKKSSRWITYGCAVMLVCGFAGITLSILFFFA